MGIGEKKELFKELGKRPGKNILMDLLTTYFMVKMKKGHGIRKKVYITLGTVSEVIEI